MVRESYHIFVRVARFVPKDESGERHNPVRYSAFGSRKPFAERQSCRSAPRSGSERASTSSRFSLAARTSTDSGVFSTSPWLSMQTLGAPVVHQRIGFGQQSYQRIRVSRAQRTQSSEVDITLRRILAAARTVIH